MSPAGGVVALAFLCASLAAGAAAADLDACEAELRQAPRTQGPARCFYQLAAAEGSRGRAARRLAQLQDQHRDDPWLGLYLGRLLWFEDQAAAERFYRQAAEAAARLGDAEAEVMARAGLVRAMRDTGRVAEAGREADLVRATAERAGDRVLIARSRVIDARQAIALGENLEHAWLGLARLDEAALAEPALWRDCQLTRAELAAQMGRYADGREALGRLEEAARAAGDRGWVAVALYYRARDLLAEQQELPTAGGKEEILALAARSAEAAVEAQRPDNEAEARSLIGPLTGGEEGARQLERCMEVAAADSRKSFCQAALAGVLAASDPARAAVEIAAAQVLAERSGDVLARIGAWNQRMRVSWSIAPREQALADSQAALDSIEALRDSQEGSVSQAGLFSTWAEHYYWLSGHLLESDLPDAVERGFAVIERMRSRTLIDALRLGERGALPPSFVSLAELRRELAGDEALLSYQVAPALDPAGEPAGGSWLLASTRETTRLYRLPDRARLRRAAGIWGGLIEKRDGHETGAASILYAQLLAQAVAGLPPGIRKLTVVPDDALHRLPFAAVRAEAGGGHLAEPLAARYQLTLAPSATLWLRLRHVAPHPAPIPALVLADPALAVEPRAAGAPRPVRLPALPYARREARAVVRHLGGGSSLALGEEASEALVKSASISSFRLLHFATHSVADAVEPERSYVQLAPGTPEEDGRLEAREIVQLDLGGRVVVLSSCSSGGGAVLRGEGVMSLARAFFQAGARTVVATLWPVRDDDGAALFDRFYRHLARGETVAAALTGAQRERLAAGAPAEAWAGAVVLGDGDAVLIPGGRPWIERDRNALLLGAGVLLAAPAVAGVVLWRRRSTARSASPARVRARRG